MAHFEYTRFSHPINLSNVSLSVIVMIAQPPIITDITVDGITLNPVTIAGSSKVTDTYTNNPKGAIANAVANENATTIAVKHLKSFKKFFMSLVFNYIDSLSHTSPIQQGQGKCSSSGIICCSSTFVVSCFVQLEHAFNTTTATNK